MFVIRDKSGYVLELSRSFVNKQEIQLVVTDNQGNELAFDLTRIQAAGLQGYIVGLLSVPEQDD